MQEITRNRPSLADETLIWMGALSIAPILFIYDLIQLDGIHLTKSHLILGRDFLNVWTGGQIALSGKTSILYDYFGYMSWQAAIFGHLDPYNYSYPPHSLFLAVPFGSLPYLTALALWTVAGASFFFWTARPYMPDNINAFCAIVTPAAVVNIWAGHYGFLIGGLWLLFFSLIKSHQKLAGVIAGFLTIKPHLGIFIALTMICRRKYKSVLIAFVTTTFLIAASGLFFGFKLWPQWLFETSALQGKIMTAPGEKFYYLMMPSAFIALRNAPDQIALVVQAGFGLAAFGLVWKARRAIPEDLAFIAASATAIVLPYIFNYDLTVASLGFLVCLYRHWAILARWEKAALWLGFAVPLLVMAFGYVGPIGLLIGLIVQVRHARSSETISLGKVRLSSRRWVIGAIG
ncbi:glycosyltransferase family 87 protein [Sphingobium quisquiliarum]|uniref:glycosyltransferase family 87 protein n=1 Tax=Sphingobium quisquiliarum TaxID=538379 RepID=UPI001F2078A9|nr:glycosyltransferase family 87 protein [Sphingobium quisquiliarum]